ncbi:MAG: hypothetical protein DCC49_07945 [Acidobacteria bacterium]|nr:MAG: hypothetical protein DCC49_07945 [Acidobacteriota bacterium]
MKQAEFRFWVDAETGEAHIYRHGVTEAEVEEVFDFGVEVHTGRGDTRVLEGPTAAGQVLRVVYLPEPDADAVFVITAYRLEGKALQSYQKRRRKRSR